MFWVLPHRKIERIGCQACNPVTNHTSGTCWVTEHGQRPVLSSGQDLDMMTSYDKLPYMWEGKTWKTHTNSIYQYIPMQWSQIDPAVRNRIVCSASSHTWSPWDPWDPDIVPGPSFMNRFMHNVLNCSMWILAQVTPGSTLVLLGGAIQKAQYPKVSICSTHMLGKSTVCKSCWLSIHKRLVIINMGSVPSLTINHIKSLLVMEGAIFSNES